MVPNAVGHLHQLVMRRTWAVRIIQLPPGRPLAARAAVLAWRDLNTRGVCIQTISPSVATLIPCPGHDRQAAKGKTLICFGLTQLFKQAAHQQAGQRQRALNEPTAV
jgi:hypothetical protein